LVQSLSLYLPSGPVSHIPLTRRRALSPLPSQEFSFRVVCPPAFPFSLLSTRTVRHRDLLVAQKRVFTGALSLSQFRTSFTNLSPSLIGIPILPLRPLVAYPTRAFLFPFTFPALPRCKILSFCNPCPSPPILLCFSF